MTIICPKCKRQRLKLSKTVCPRCHFRITVREVWRLYWRRFRLRFRRNAATQCPDCGNAIPLLANGCAVCGKSLTVRHVLKSSLGPAQQRMQRAISMPPRWTIRTFRWLYLVASIVLPWRFLPWHLLPPLDLDSLPKLLIEAVLLIIFIAAFALLSAWVVPRHLFAVIAQHTPPVVRVSLLFNLLTGLFLLEAAISAWWEKALALGALFAVTWLGATLLCRFFWPLVVEGREIFQVSDSFDASKPQGRKVAND